MVDWTLRRFIFSDNRGGTKFKPPLPRIVYFPRLVEGLLRWLRHEHGNRSETVFLDALHRPWRVHRLAIEMR